MSPLEQPITTHRFVVEIAAEPEPVYEITPEAVETALENGGFVGHMGIEVKTVKDAELLIEAANGHRADSALDDALKPFDPPELDVWSPAFDPTSDDPTHEA